MSLQLIKTSIEEGRNVFLTGPGGCGKSYLLKQLFADSRRAADSDQAHTSIVSTTGVSAHAIGAPTIHSWCSIVLPSSNHQLFFAKMLKRIAADKKLLARFKRTCILFIDEVSMLGGNYLDILDHTLRTFRKSDAPFGGIQLVVSGDMLQLPPVNDLFCFEAECWPQLRFEFFFLKNKYRFSDPLFCDILERARVGLLEPSDLILLNQSKKSVSSDIIPTVLYSHRKDVDSYNKECLDALPEKLELVSTRYFREKDQLKKELKAENCMICGEHSLKSKRPIAQLYPCGHSFHWTCISTWNMTSCPCCSSPVDDFYELGYEPVEDVPEYVKFASPKILELKKQAQVMLIVNLNVEQGLVNGSRGVVREIHDKYVVVEFLRCTRNIEKHLFYFEADERRFSCLQFPLQLCWSSTIHKTQGLSLDYVQVKLDKCFAGGQAYVALSRCRTLDGLFLEKKLSSTDVRPNPTALAFEKDLKSRCIFIDN
jgi:ATP-dependent DNA helicase PIF1